MAANEEENAKRRLEVEAYLVPLIHVAQSYIAEKKQACVVSLARGAVVCRLADLSRIMLIIVETVQDQI